MKNAMRYIAGLSAVGALGVMTVVAGARVKAQDVAPMVATGQFGLVGAARGEAARLSVSNINALPPDVCHAVLSFVDASGDVLLRPDGSPLRREVTLAAGHSAFLQFQARTLIGRNDTRVNFRPVVSVPLPDPGTPPDPCVPSLEIIENATGQSRLVNPGAARTYSANHNETLVRDR